MNENMVHDANCKGCEHDCPWKKNPIGSPYCQICDDHWEAGAGPDMVDYRGKPGASKMTATTDNKPIRK